MAKDPAFLFYPGDWLGGTMGLTFEEKGAYLELLIFQFNNGKFTESQAKQVLSICQASALHNVLHKFSKEGNHYHNKRLEEEIKKRKAFSESRRNNALGAKNKDSNNKNRGGTSKAYASHMENENENENIIRIEVDFNLEKKFMIEDSLWFEQFKMKWESIDFTKACREFSKLKVGQEFEDKKHLRNSFITFIKNYNQNGTNGSKNWES